MTYENPDPALLPPAESKKTCWKRKLSCFLFTLLLIVAAAAATLSLPELLQRQPMNSGEDTTALKQRLSLAEDRLKALELRVTDISDHNVQPAAPSPAPQVSIDNKSSNEIAHLENDVASLMAALSNLQMEVKQTGTHALHTQQITQTTLASAITFIQLREAAITGQSFTSELTTMRDTSKQDAVFQEILTGLEPFAAKGAPPLAVLQNEFLGLEPSAAQTIAKNEAQNWWGKIVAEIKGLISIRKQHGGNTTDALADIETSLSKGEISTALESLSHLPLDAQQVLADWRSHIEARQKIDVSLHKMADHFIVLANPSDTTTPVVSPSTLVPGEP